jgi:hypothetical protein
MVHLDCSVALHGRRFRIVQRGVLGLGLMMVHYYDYVPLQGWRFREACVEVLGSGLILRHLCDDSALLGKRESRPANSTTSTQTHKMN